MESEVNWIFSNPKQRGDGVCSTVAIDLNSDI